MTKTVGASSDCDFLQRAIAARSGVDAHRSFVLADEIDAAHGGLIEPLARAVALHSGCSPDSLPRAFYVTQSFRRTMQTLVFGKAIESAPNQLLLNVEQAIDALRNGELTTIWVLPDELGNFRYNEMTPIDLEVFYKWATRVRLPVAGPWAVRGQAPDRVAGYVATFTVRPWHAGVSESLDRKFGSELAAGCPQGWLPLIDYCVEKFGLSRQEAIRVVSGMDPRREHRGRIKSKNS